MMSVPFSYPAFPVAPGDEDGKMAYDAKLKEEEIKNKVAADWFPGYDCTRILGNVDFCVQPKDEGPTLWETESLLWAEAKAGIRTELAPLFAQLILTIGREKTHERHSPPPFLGAFDCEKIAFLPYHAIVDFFAASDFDWTVTPSDTGTREFGLLLDRVRPLLAAEGVIFRFGADRRELAAFVKRNLVAGRDETERLPVTRNNFVFVWNRWREAVMPSIAVDWAVAKGQGILDADFFLADLLSTRANTTLVNNLFVLLRDQRYELGRTRDSAGFLSFKTVGFKDGQTAHTAFWNRYKRPPRKEFWNWIAERRDLLVPQDVRERKGSFFTPHIWVEKAQEAIAAALGEDWQDEYAVWDCAAGTGNLLAGLSDKYRIWASTLDQADVDVMHERIKNGANLLDSHVFRFDFLNGSFDELPDGLRQIVQDPERRKKLLVFINPPYAEATTAPTKDGVGMKPGVAKETLANKKYKPLIGAAANELFALFLIRVSHEISGCAIGQFSTLKHTRAPNFKLFRNAFRAELKQLFIVPANTFDNVKGHFPIGFHVWRTGTNHPNFSIDADVLDAEANWISKKQIGPVPQLIAQWVSQFRKASGECIGYERMQGSDFQNSQFTNIVNAPSEAHASFLPLTYENLIPACIHFAARLSVEDNWLVHNDLFSFPLDSWLTDGLFQTDCLVFTLFHGKNRISCKSGTNHWIPFTEVEVNARDAFHSHFMSDFLHRGAPGPSSVLDTSAASKTLVLTVAARAVLNAGRALWRYYHEQPEAEPDASFYDIRAHFQGFKPNGHMNPDSPDPAYTALLATLRTAMRALAATISPKVREHGFLR
jgi:hypothetical protein